ncbi:MAG TPA: enoyl-CoA hydratase-related protein [Acidimicrobiia bacterium]
MPVHYETREEHIVLITIDRPEARNSADMEHFKQLREAWERFRDDGDAWVAIITGVGDAFFVGADLKSYIPQITKLAQEIGENGRDEIDGYRLDDGTKAVLRDFPLSKPVIAAVNGFCTAGGMEMLGGTDLRVCCPEAKFAVMEPKRGLFAGGGTTVRLPRQIPWPMAMEFLLCADLIPAARAYEMGLVNAVVPRDELIDTALAFARRITANAPLAVQATKASALAGLYVDDHFVHTSKRALRSVLDALTAVADALDHSLADAASEARLAIAGAEQAVKELRSAFQQESSYSNSVFRSDDAKEGPKAFAEKRPPIWKGR